MSNDFLPQNDKEMIVWAIQFVSIATANITATQLTDAQITALKTKMMEVQTALDDVEAKRNAAKAANLVKNDKVNALNANVRELNRILQDNANVINETKVKLGLQVRPTRRKPIEPVIPTKLQVVGNSRNENVLTWDAAGNHANTIYELQASYGEGEPFFIVTLLTGTRYTHRGVKPGQEMIYRICAKRGKKASGYSNLATVYPNVSSAVILPKKPLIEMKKAA